MWPIRMPRTRCTRLHTPRTSPRDSSTHDPQHDKADEQSLKEGYTEIDNAMSMEAEQMAELESDQVREATAFRASQLAGHAESNEAVSETLRKDEHQHEGGDQAQHENTN